MFAHFQEKRPFDHYLGTYPGANGFFSQSLSVTLGQHRWNRRYARAAFHDRINDFVILPEIVTFDPLAPAFCRGDPQWEGNPQMGRSMRQSRLEASGATRANVDTTSSSEDPRTGRLLTKLGGLGKAPRLQEACAAHGSKRSATTAKCSNAMPGSARRSNSIAAGTPCGPRGN